MDRAIRYILCMVHPDAQDLHLKETGPVLFKTKEEGCGKKVLQPGQLPASVASYSIPSPHFPTRFHSVVLVARTSDVQHMVCRPFALQATRHR